MIPQKLRAGALTESEPDAPDGALSAPGARNALDPASARGDGVNVGVRDKK